ncbi:cytochrome P450 [Aspergillus avenaceus]|uniref:Cytochrome P450 n=1 Tax=Aspergillus avenaceus TaxID=36643 RepID=A0A5N6TXX6_ASPAV|nr:cytochrome P450 [Aspergillus avenaceus]
MKIQFTLQTSILLLIAYVFLRKLSSKRNHLPLPDGPKPMPVLGNVHEMLRTSPTACFQRWHRKYGPIITVRCGRQLVISIGDHGIAHNLLNKKGAIYSSRPRFIIASEYMTSGMNTAIIPCGKLWQSHHRIMAPLLDKSSIKKYEPLLDLESLQALSDLLSSDDYSKDLSRYITSILMTLGYMDIEQINKYLFEFMGNIYASLVELFPVLEHVPSILAPWKKTARYVERKTTDIHVKNLELAMKSCTWNWAQNAAQSKTGQQLSTKELAYGIGTFQQAGYDATLILDQIVGSSRLPSFKDLPHLPYLSAMVTEATRWQPPAPFAIPHATTEDSEYMEYHIPKDTIIIPNMWVMSFDNEAFPEPYELKPEMWLQNPDMVHSPFGFGRRLCPGRHLGMSMISILLARLLWAYDISHVYRDGKKVEVDPWDLKFTFTASSAPFEASFSVRSPQHKGVIESTWAEAEKDIGKILESIRSANDL